MRTTKSKKAQTMTKSRHSFRVSELRPLEIKPVLPKIPTPPPAAEPDSTRSETSTPLSLYMREVLVSLRVRSGSGAGGSVGILGRTGLFSTVANSDTLKECRLLVIDWAFFDFVILMGLFQLSRSVQ